MIRMIAPHEGPLVRDLMVKCAVSPLVTTVDWTRPLGPYWLVAQRTATHFDGAINVAYSQPMGRVDQLLVDPTLPKRVRAMLCKHLCYAAFEVLSRHGAQLSASYIHDAQRSWQQIAQHHGCLPVETGTLFLRKV